MDEWEKRGFSPDGIYTGFLADEEQADKILDFLRRFRKEKTVVLVDPVMGDNGGAYGIYTEGLRERMVQLVRSAQVITPNLTEALLLLYGKEEMEKRYARAYWNWMKEKDAFGADRKELADDSWSKEYWILKAAVIHEEVEYVREQKTCAKFKGKKSMQMGNLVVENGQCLLVFCPKERRQLFRNR